MKRKIFKFAFISTLLLAGCQKEKMKDKVPKEVENTSNLDGISVEAGRLRFSDTKSYFALFDKLSKNDGSFYKTLSSLSGFKSRMQSKTNQTSAKPSSGCNCDLADEDLLTAVINEDFMLDIGDWTLKVNACDENVYAFYRPLYTEAQINARIDALVACDFGSNYDFFNYTFEHDIMQELEISADSINGNEDAGEVRCVNHAASSREDWLYARRFTIAINYNDFDIFTPVLRLRYHRGVFQGRIFAYMDYEKATPNTMNAYYYDFEQTYYTDRCSGASVASPVGHQSSQFVQPHGTHAGLPPPFNSSALVQYINIYNGDRLKAGYGRVKVRARYDDPNYPSHHTDYAEIVF